MILLLQEQPLTALFDLLEMLASLRPSAADQEVCVGGGSSGDSSSCSTASVVASVEALLRQSNGEACANKLAMSFHPTSGEQSAQEAQVCTTHVLCEYTVN